VRGEQPKRRRDAAKGCRISARCPSSASAAVGQTLNVYAQTDIGLVVASVSNAMQREAKVAESGDSVTVSSDRSAQLIFRET
jgi:hypothetical protein